MENMISNPSENIATATPHGRISKTIGYYVAFIALGLTSASLGPTLPGLAEHTRTNLAQISILFTARSIGYLLGSLQGGRYYDRKAGHPVFTIMLLIMAATMAIAPTISLLCVLFLVLLILGAAEGAIDVGGNTLLVWVHRDRVGPYMNGLHFFFGIGAFLSPVIIAQAMLFSGDISWAYWILAFLMLPVALFLYRLPSPPHPLIIKDKTTGQTNRVLMVLVVTFFFLYVAAEVSFGGWIFTYATNIGMKEVAAAAYLTSAFWGSITIGRLFAIPAAANFRPHTILFFDLLTCLTSLVIILLASGNPVVLWVGTIGVGLSMASIFPTMISFAGQRLTITGRVTSWFFIGASGGGIVLPWLIGQLFENFGPQATMITILVDMIAAAAVYIVLNNYSPHPHGKLSTDR